MSGAIDESGSLTSPQVAVVLSPTLQIYGEESIRSPSKDVRSPSRGSPATMTSSPMSPVAVVSKRHFHTSQLFQNRDFFSIINLVILKVLSPSATSLKMSPSGSMVFAMSPKCLSPNNLSQSQVFVAQSQSECCSPTVLSQTCESEDGSERLYGSREHDPQFGKQEQYVVSQKVFSVKMCSIVITDASVWYPDPFIV